MSLKRKIITFLNKENRKVSMNEIYNEFSEEKKTTVRGRVYRAMGNGITRIGKGLYISSKAIVEHGNALKIIDRMVQEGDKFEFIFLDIPYDANGARGSRRDMFELDKISAKQFEIFIKKCEKLLCNERSPMVFMFTSGKCSKPQHDAYVTAIENSNFKRCNRSGFYEKLWSNGKPMNMGKYLMPKEHIYVYSLSGEVDNIEQWVLDFSMCPKLREYPTSKPYEMIKQIVKQATKVKDWVFDPFAGSGKTLQACIELDRYCHTIDISETSINEHLIPILL